MGVEERAIWIVSLGISEGVMENINGEEIG